MNKSIFLLVAVWIAGCLANPFQALAEGTVNFANDSSCKVTNGLTLNPVTSAQNIKAALYWSPTNLSAFTQIGSNIMVGEFLDGIFAGGTRTTGPATAGGHIARFQVRAWGGGYTNYEQALLFAGTLVGTSAVIQVATGNPAGDPPTPASSLVAAGLQGFTLNPAGAPPFTLTCASNKATACGGPWSFDAPTTSGGCGSVSVIVLTTITNGSCPRLFTRTWQATDGCTTQTCSQVVTTLDSIPPTITCASNKVEDCTAAWAFDAPSVQDNCSTPMLYVMNTVTNAQCGGTFSATRTWGATDPCGNSNSCSQTVTVVDTTPPILTCASNKFVSCGAAWQFDEPSATDACAGTNLLTTVAATVTNTVCPLVVTRTWSVVDACGNSNTCSQTVTTTPALPPTLVCATNKVVHCTNEWSFDAPTALDACGDTNVSVEVSATATNSLCPLSLTRTWRATNDCNPEGILCSQTVTVLCPSCPVLQLAKSCPPHPVPPGGTLAWSGTITNGGDIVVSNIVVVNDKPAPNTPVFGPITLAPGEGASFAGSYTVPACFCGPHVDTLTATGVGLGGLTFTGSATASCAGTNHITPGDMNGDGIVDQAELNAVLANYWPNSQWIYMTNAALLCNGRFQFALTNAGAWNFTVLVSTNATDWSPLPSPAFPVYQFVDPEGTNAPQRLYRLQWP